MPGNIRGHLRGVSALLCFIEGDGTKSILESIRNHLHFLSVPLLWQTVSGSGKRRSAAGKDQRIGSCSEEQELAPD